MTINSILLIIVMSLPACGTNNLFSELETGDHTAEEASQALDSGNYEKAISILSKALEGDASNYQYISLLASAKAQAAGVDTMDFALTLISPDSATTGDGITALFGVVPNATTETIALLEEAISLMASIPTADLIEADEFKSSLFYAALMTMRTKLLDADGDGQLSATELASLDDTAAAAIMTAIIGADSAISAISSSDGIGSAATNISDIKSNIDAQAGSTDAERLSNYLSGA